MTAGVRRPAGRAGGHLMARLPLSLAARDLAATPGRSALAALGIALGSMVLALGWGLGLAVRDLVLREVVRELPIDTVEVRPQALDLGLFKVDAGGLLGGARLDAATMARLAAAPAVAAVYPRLDVPLPLTAQGGGRLLGRRLRTDLWMSAVPAELLEPDLRPRFVDRPGSVPVLVSDQLIAIFNAQIAGAIGAPQLGPTSLDGFSFELLVGQSNLPGTRATRRTGVEAAQIVGASRYALRLGVTVPLATAYRLLREYGVLAAGAEDTLPYSALWVRARSAADLPAVVACAESLGLEVDVTAQRARRLLTAATALFASVGGLMLGLAALNVANTFAAVLLARRRELGILRAVGARRRRLASMLLLEAGALGALGGVGGLLCAHALGAIADRAAHRLLTGVPFLPPTLFVWPAWLQGTVLALAVLTAVLGAVGPALWAAARPLPAALSD